MVWLSRYEEVTVKGEGSQDKATRIGVTKNLELVEDGRDVLEAHHRQEFVV